MNPEFPQTPREEMEARLTALLLGELSADEAAAVREAIAQDAELAKLHARLEKTLGLVREAAASTSEPATTQAAPLKLSEDRREKLLAHFKTIAPKEFVQEKKRTRLPLVELAAAVAILGVLAAVSFPALKSFKLHSMVGLSPTKSVSLAQVDIASTVSLESLVDGKETDSFATSTLHDFQSGNRGESLSRSSESARPARPQIALPAAGDRDRELSEKKVSESFYQPLDAPGKPASRPARPQIALPAVGQSGEAGGLPAVETASRDFAWNASTSLRGFYDDNVNAARSSDRWDAPIVDNKVQVSGQVAALDSTTPKVNRLAFPDGGTAPTPLTSEAIKAPANQPVVDPSTGLPLPAPAAEPTAFSDTPTVASTPAPAQQSGPRGGGRVTFANTSDHLIAAGASATPPPPAPPVTDPGAKAPVEINLASGLTDLRDSEKKSAPNATVDVGVEPSPTKLSDLAFTLSSPNGTRVLQTRPLRGVEVPSVVASGGTQPAAGKPVSADDFSERLPAFRVRPETVKLAESLAANPAQPALQPKALADLHAGATIYDPETRALGIDPKSVDTLASVAAPATPPASGTDSFGRGPGQPPIAPSGDSTYSLGDNVTAGGRFYRIAPGAGGGGGGGGQPGSAVTALSGASTLAPAVTVTEMNSAPTEPAPAKEPTSHGFFGGYAANTPKPADADGDKAPVLGDLPTLGQAFRSESSDRGRQLERQYERRSPARPSAAPSENRAFGVDWYLGQKLTLEQKQALEAAKAGEGKTESAAVAANSTWGIKVVDGKKTFGDSKSLEQAQKLNEGENVNLYTDLNRNGRANNETAVAGGKLALGGEKSEPQQLSRRLALDLNGLPPTEKEGKDFLEAARFADTQNSAPINEFLRRPATAIVLPGSERKLSEESVSNKREDILSRYAELSGRQVITSAGNREPGKSDISGLTPEQRAKELQTINATLAQNGLSMIPMGDKFVKAVPSAQAGAAGAAISKGASIEGQIASAQKEFDEITVLRKRIDKEGISDFDASARGPEILTYTVTATTTNSLSALDGHQKQGNVQLGENSVQQLSRAKLNAASQSGGGGSNVNTLNVVGYVNKKAALLPQSMLVEVLDRAEPAKVKPTGPLAKLGSFFATGYEGKARIKAERDQTDISSLSDQQAVAGYDPYFIQTEFEEIQSEVVLGKVVDKLKLDETWAKKNGGKKLTKAEALGMLRGKLDLKPVGSTSLVEIAAKSDKPDEAAQLANAVADAYQEHRKQKGLELITGGIEALKEQDVAQEQKIKEARAEVDRLRKEIGISDYDAMGTAPTPSLDADVERRLQGEALTFETQLAAQIVQLTNFTKLSREQRRDAVRIAIGPDAELDKSITEYNLAVSKLNPLQDLKTEDAAFKQKQNELEELGKKVDQRIDGILIGLSNRVDVLQAQHKAIETKLKEARANDIAKAEASRPYYQAKGRLEDLLRFRSTLNTKVASESVAAGIQNEDPLPIRKPATNAPVPQAEVQTSENNFSTFSLNVSDVSFKLTAASLEKGQMPDVASLRSEEFINAFDYRDPEASPGAAIAFAWERARYPFAHNRDLLRFSVKTAAEGRVNGRPLNIVLLLDNSGSMERSDRVSIIREALRVLASQLQPQDKLSVITFARTPRLWVDGIPGDKAGEVADQVSDITPQGGTNIEDAMKLAYATAARHYLANGINRVVLLTDGAANLGNVEPDSLKQTVESQRKQGIALDCFGIGWEGFNDDLLEVLSRNGDGRYGFINSPAEAASEFAGQLAGALQVAASDVKVQVEFNPKRATAYRQIGYAKHQLKKEQFRDNTVDAAEIAAQEAGNALYTAEVNPAGSGPICTVRVRYKIPGTTDYREQEWDVPYTGNSVPLESSSTAMRLAASASAFAEWLVASPFAGEVSPDRLLNYLSGVPEIYGADARPKKLEWMIRQAKSIEGK